MQLTFPVRGRQRGDARVCSSPKKREILSNDPRAEYFSTECVHLVLVRDFWFWAKRATTALAMPISEIPRFQMAELLDIYHRGIFRVPFVRGALLNRANPPARKSHRVIGDSLNFPRGLNIPVADERSLIVTRTRNGRGNATILQASVILLAYLQRFFKCVSTIV